VRRGEKRLPLTHGAIFVDQLEKRSRVRRLLEERLHNFVSHLALAASKSGKGVEQGGRSSYK
jgi:hypothetical protein